MEFKPDCVVIGSGPLGAVCARKLSEQGLNVLILEAGKVISSPPGSHFRNQPHYQKNPDDFFHEVGKWCEYYNNNAPEEGLPGANITTAFGGQSVIWTNNCPRPTPYFKEWDVFDKATWEKRLSEAERLLYVNTHLFDNSVRQEKIFKHLNQYLQKNMPDRSICKLPVAATLSQGNIEFTATENILDAPVEITSRIKIECEMKVIELIKKGEKIIAVKALNKNNEIIEIPAKYFIIAGGIFGTTQLLYDSHIRPAALGKYLHLHPLWFAQLLLNEKLSAPDDRVDLPPKLYIPPTEKYPWHAMILRDIFTVPADKSVHPNRLLELQFFAPQEVREENQMILSHSKPCFNVKLSMKDKSTLEAMYADLLDITKQLGNFREMGKPAQTPFGFTHPMGTCRMGNDTATSVVDKKSRVYGFSNLFLASVAVIPISIAINPTLTAAALALEAVAEITRD